MIMQGRGIPEDEDFFCLPAKGVYTSECGTFWSTEPITRDQKAYDIIWNFCWRHRVMFEELKEQLREGRKTYIPKWVRIWFLEN